MKITTLALALTLSVSLSGCFGMFRQSERPPIVFRPIEIPDVQPTPMSLRAVNWEVYTVSELRSMLEQMEANGDGNAVFYVLPKEGYESLAFNLAEMKRFIEDQKSTNEFLIEAIEINNSANTTPSE